MAEEKRFIIPLRKEFSKAPKYKRAKKSVTAVRQFISKHMKVQDVKIGKHLNHKLWTRGSKRPPAKVEVHAIKEEDHAKVELVGFEFEKKVEVEKKPEKEIKPAEKLEEKVLKDEQQSKEQLAKEGKVELKEQELPIPDKSVKETQREKEKKREEGIVAAKQKSDRSPSKVIREREKK